jgi:C-terminal processing protease CtpA/Prc
MKIQPFHPDLIPDRVAAVAALREAPGILIDLRGNPGGDAATCEQMAARSLEGQVTSGSFRLRSEIAARTVAGENSYSGPLAILMVPVAELHTPDGTVLEGRGVIPDIAVSLERSQLLEGIDAQLQAALDDLVEAGR